MTDDVSEQRALTAVQEFNAARTRAVLEQILGELTGRPADLLAYEDVRAALGARVTGQRELREIPLAAIVGSVGRYGDFTRSFLPRHDKNEGRWTKVWAKMGNMEGLPPIEVYEVGDAYFVSDGNHRVSVARQQGASHIEAYVTKVSTVVPLSPEDTPEDLILKARYARFLEATELHQVFPAADLTMSVAGNYRLLAHEIEQQQRQLEEERGQAVPYTEAARLWYEEVYLPLIRFIRQRGILRDFPARTETDLYVWLIKHRAALAAQLGWSLDAATAVLDLADKQSKGSGQVVQRLGQKLKEAVTPPVLEAGPTVGEWRASWLATYREDRLFSHILVAIDGQEAGWHALQQAVRVAWREESTLFGLHVVEDDETVGSARAQTVRAEFERRCEEAGIPGELTITSGPVTGTICYRARWADLVVVSLSHPPGPQPRDRLSSQMAQLLRRCPRPLLAVPDTATELDRLVLAYDGSPKANEALLVAAYLAGQWQVPLTVVVALGKQVTAATAAEARARLAQRHVQVEYVVAPGAAAPLILEAAQARAGSLILMGGYGQNPVLEIVVGSVVDEVLRARSQPVLICR